MASEGEETVHCLTIRLIRSFEYRNIRNMVLHDVKLSSTIAELKQLINQNVQTTGAFISYRKHNFDTVQLYSQPHSFKPNSLTIETSVEDPMSHVLDDTKTLKEAGIQNETELTYFNLVDYLAFLKAPVDKWT